MQLRDSSVRRTIYLTLGVLVLSLGIFAVYYFVTFAPLRNTEWELSAINGNPPPRGVNVTLKFSDSTVSGSTLCHNTFSGRYAITTDSKIATSDVAITQVACADNELSMLDITYMNVLFGTPTFAIRNERLELRDSAGATVLLFTRK